VIKKYFLKGVYVGLLLLSGSAMAELKLAYVNAAMLLDQAPQAQKAAAKMKAEFGARETSLISGKRELDELQAQLSRDGAVMSEDKRKTMRLDIMSRQRELVRNEEALRQDVAIRRNDVIGGLQLMIRSAIDDVGKKGGYSIIFYEGIAYADPLLDISASVLETLKKQDAKTGK